MLFVVALSLGQPPFYWMFAFPVLLLGPGLDRIRSRTTYPRIGYAKLSGEHASRFGRSLLFGAAGVALLAVAVLAIRGELTSPSAWRQAAPALAGVLLAFGYFELARHTRLRRYWGLGVVAVALGLAMVFRSEHEPYHNVRLWALLMALISWAVAAVVFARFVRRHPKVAERQPDE